MNLSLYTICPLNGEIIFAATVYFDTSEASLMRAMEVMSKSYLTLVYFSTNIPMVLEICLLYDLVLTLKRPMSQQAPRVKWYFALAITVSTIFVASFIAEDFNGYDIKVQIVFYLIHGVYIFSYFACGIYTCIQLNKGGLN